MKPEGWEGRLNEYIESRRFMPFEWGKNDCASFAAYAVEAMTGELPGKGDLGKYNCHADAIILLENLNSKGNAPHRPYAEIMALLPELFGFKEVAVKLAQRGDLLLVKHGDEIPALAIVSLDPRLAVAPGEKGIKFIEVLKDGLKAWRVS
jgi:hypothetical protein